MRFVTLFLKGLDSDSDMFCFLNANPFSTIGKNVKNIMYKYHIPPPTMFGSNYASVANLIKKMYENDVDEVDRAHASVLSMAEWLRAWDTFAMMKLWRREVVSSIPDRGTIVG